MDFSFPLRPPSSLLILQLYLRGYKFKMKYCKTLRPTHSKQPRFNESPVPANRRLAAVLVGKNH